MTAKDQLKVLKAGLFIIREDQINLAIKRKTGNQPDWHILQKGYKSKAALRRAMDELLVSANVIED